ncbi:hypothetical protein TIFTF001_055139, partial [Ficus carica]
MLSKVNTSLGWRTWNKGYKTLRRISSISGGRCEMGCLEASSDCFGCEILLEPALVSVSSWPSLSSGVVRDFGVEGLEDNALMCFEEGREKDPNKWFCHQPEHLHRPMMVVVLPHNPRLPSYFFLKMSKCLTTVLHTTVLHRTTVMVLVIMTAFPS